MIAVVRFILLALLSRVPVILSARLLARIAHRPLRLVLGLLLQPLLTLAADYWARRVTAGASARATPANDPLRRRDTLMVSGRAAALRQWVSGYAAASRQSSRRR